jgi:alpha-L-fucosidase
MKSSVILLIFIFFTGVFAQRGAYTNESPEIKAERMKWYTDARFGMFIHWGAYSVLNGEYKGKKQKDPKGEWVMNHLKIPVDEYRDSVVAKFNPLDFNADKWAALAKDAGMKYIVITTKHHDGFAMFHSKVSGFNIVDATPFKRDVIKELSEACRKQGLRFGIYYSQAQDWHYPGGLTPSQRWDKKQEGDWTQYFKTIVKGQVSELLTNYGKISLLWWDSGRKAQNKAVADSVGSALVKLQPDIIVNPRLGGYLKGDFQTYEQVIPAVFFDDYGYRELCLTHNRSWSYKKSDKEWKSPEFILRVLVQMASEGANFLFNVGPDPLGNIPEPSVNVLHYIGDWMKINGEAIYSTDKSPFYNLHWGYATVKEEKAKTTLYLHVFEWPRDKTLFVPGLKNSISSAYLLEGHKILSAETGNKGVTIKGLPVNAPHPAVSVIALEIKEPLKAESGYIHPRKDGLIELKAVDALFTIKPQFEYIPQIAGEKGDEYIDNWRRKYPVERFKNTGNAVHWKVELDGGGMYKAYAAVSTKCDKNIVTLQKKKVILPDTGGMDKFEQVCLGEFELQKGVNTITFTGGNRDEIWDYVRLKGIILNPAE